MILSRSAATAVCLLVLSANAATAQVHLVVGANGRKKIYNVGPVRSASGSQLAWLAKQRDRVTRFEPLIQKYAGALNVDPLLVKAVIQVESNFNPGCVSNKGARGLMQLMPETARRFNVSQVHDPDQNIRGGVTYLAKLMDMFPADLPRTLAAYNAGENKVLRYHGIPPYEETMTYVQRALTVYYGRPYGGRMEISRSSFGTLPVALKGGFSNLPPATFSLARNGAGLRKLALQAIVTR